MKYFIQIRVVTLLAMLFIGFLSGNSMAGGFDANQPTSTVYVDSFNSEIVVENQVDKDFSVQVFDLTGKEISRSDVSDGSSVVRIKTSQLKRGVYLIRLTPVANAPSATFKIMLR